MLAHYKQITRRFNSLKTRKRYREKRERRAFLTEAFNDGELALYKPFIKTPFDMMHKQANETFIPADVEFSQLDIKEAEVKADKIIKDLGLESIQGAGYKPIKLTWFEKLILWIRNWLHPNK